MKKIHTIVVIALFFSVLVLPVIAANEGQGIHAGITNGAGDNKGQSHDNNGNNNNKNNTDKVGENTTSPLPTPETSRGENGNRPTGTPRNIPGLNNQNEGNSGAVQRNASTIPPGWVRNPNEVRDAVHSLLAVENRTGGIGPQVSAIAREFNNSANASQQDENRIVNRSAFIRFFIGDDQQAANELANLTAENKARIDEIENLMNTTTLDPDTLSMMDEQLQVLQQNVAFDQQLSAQAKQNRGIFGWFG